MFLLMMKIKQNIFFIHYFIASLLDFLLQFINVIASDDDLLIEEVNII